MIHLNGNILCVFDTETTGLDPMVHSIWQFACIPLDFRLNPHKDISPFEITLSPANQVFDRKAIPAKRFEFVKETGVPQEVGVELFYEWFQRLPLGFKKRICPLAHNWPFDREFIRAWLGDANFDFCFDARYRDTMALAAAVCDSCDFHAEEIPFESYTLRQVATKLGIMWDDRLAHDAYYDCTKAIEVYKALVKRIKYI